MISAPVALAFTAGMVATFNPCGFSLLPAYLGAFVAGDATELRADQRVMRAVGVAAAVSLGFVVVFATAGLVIDQLTSATRQRLPWVTIIIGAALVLAGIAMVLGWKPSIAVRGPDLASGRRGIAAMTAYGATFAIASLSCTIGPFLAVTGVALSQSTTLGIATHVAYALGMGTIILAISVFAALAHTTLIQAMRKLTRVMTRLGGALMIAAGGYAIWYGRWELGVYAGDLDADPIIDTIEDLRLRIVENIETIGAGRIALAVVLSAGLAVAAVRWNRAAGRHPDPDRSVPSA
ncbi:cytochrome c biogenesis CcdA family protein [Actinomarinicola tropica]|uniref:Cytochrome c biogenesis protein CcdA n=1 Tax=Actinomarinicola tropica TaxID=2789776 RepID=A0A5Q2RJZ6_9ACTN|nr:cytochrome c biogenesis CcdA family protein [Actinomarinicola tropica]QGG94170.1 cytochrome c biogenesis protein CcdA [Actinomarinicola tropica]